MTTRRTPATPSARILRRQAPRSRRSGLAPLELVLALPFLLAILALMIDLGIEVKWKIRALAVSRQAVWRERSGRRGASDPRPAGWPLQNATLASIPGAPPPIFPQDPFGANAVVRGPSLRDPQGAAPESQLIVDTNMLDISGEVRQGQAKIDRKYPVFPALPGVHLNVDHLLVDSQWRFGDRGMGFAATESRRGKKLYQFNPPPQVQEWAGLFGEAAQRIVDNPLRADLDPFGMGGELRRRVILVEPGTPREPMATYHKVICRCRTLQCSDCTLNVGAIASGTVAQLIDCIQGKFGDGKGGVPSDIANGFIELYSFQVAQLRAQDPPPEAAIESLVKKIERLQEFRGGRDPYAEQLPTCPN